MVRNHILIACPECDKKQYADTRIDLHLCLNKECDYVTHSDDFQENHESIPKAIRDEISFLYIEWCELMSNRKAFLTFRSDLVYQEKHYCNKLNQKLTVSMSRRKNDERYAAVDNKIDAVMNELTEDYGFVQSLTNKFIMSYELRVEKETDEPATGNEETIIH